MGLNVVVMPALYWLYGERAVASERESDDLPIVLGPPAIATATYG